MENNNKLPHGLLVENFRQSILNFVMESEIDIQTKAIVLDNINFKVQRLSEQKTQQELEEYRLKQNRDEQDNPDGK